ncbi:MAG TPA: hypothetical protein VFV34_28085, partial [Blastocatellia bacterium]|nr:hypothetical protein [Blastocatellia bacterium]
MRLRRRAQGFTVLLRLISGSFVLAGLLALCGVDAQGQTEAPTAPCSKTVTANVVAFDQVVFYNRFGAFNPGSMIYALRRDVVAIDPTQPIGSGNVQLRPDKRARPIVLRVNEGDCLQVN